MEDPEAVTCVSQQIFISVQTFFDKNRLIMMPFVNGAQLAWPKGVWMPLMLKSTHLYK